VSQHFIQLGSIEVSGVKLQVVPAQQPEVSESEQCFTGISELDISQATVIEVSWSNGDLRRETLLMYLENQKRSGGGPVKDLRFFAEDQKAYVRFVDAECKLLYCILSQF